MISRACVGESMTINELDRLWALGEPFFVTASVIAPYDGCFHEPNIWLITPIGCEMYEQLMGQIPSRYPAMRESLEHKFDQLQGHAERLVGKLDWMWDEARGDCTWKAKERCATCEQVSEVYDELQRTEAERDELEALLGDVRKGLGPMDQPPLICWPLYASGQGRAMDCVHSLEELKEVMVSETCEKLARRPRWPEGLLGTRLGSEKTYGPIRHFEVAAMGPINEVTGVGERYWMKALEVAYELWGLELSWKCQKCGHSYSGCEYKAEPTPTGYHGDGGIGVHWTGVMCPQCIEEGMCEMCRERGCMAAEAYDDDVAKHGWSLCAECTEHLLKGLVCGNVQEVHPNADTVHLSWQDDSEQLSFAEVERDKKLNLVIDIKGQAHVLGAIRLNTHEILARAEKSYELEDRLDPEHGCGLWLSWEKVAELAQDAWDALDEDEQTEGA